jgi:hypothetical protein
MKSISKIAILLMLVLFVSCGEKADEMKQAMEMLEDLPEKAEKIEEAVDKAEQKRKDRIVRGDTLALNFRELIEMLPKELNGYTAGEPKGETVKMAQFSFSNAEIRFTKQLEDGSQSYVDINLIDYNSAMQMYQSAVAMWAAGFSIENSEMTQKSWEPGIEDCAGFETYYFKRKEGEIQLGVGYRFFVDAKATHIDDIDFLKDVVKELPLEKLSKM